LSALDRRPPADPKNGSQWRLRAEIHARQKDWAAAAADVREYLKLNPDKRWLAVGSWVAGPYSDDPNAGYPPEGDAAFAQTADANGGSLKSDDVRWQSVPSNANGFINFSSLYNHAEHMSAYALMRIYAPEKCPVAILLGSDDQVRLWLNGKLIHENLQFRRAAPDADATSTILAAGWNSLLARVINATGEHALYLRLSDPPADLLRAQNEAKH
jgi:hypothetical protein